MPTADLASALGWYEKLLGRPADRLPHADEAVWQLTESALIYVVSDAERAGNGLLTLIVDDLEAQLAALRQRGLDPGPIETLPNAVRRVGLTDPDGNRIQIGQLPGRSEPTAGPEP